MIEFKISDAADQKFSAIINNRRVTFRFRYNYVSESWFFDLALDGDYVLHGRKIIPNVDLIDPYDFGIGSLFAHSETKVRAGRQEMVNGLVRFYQVSEAEKNAALA